MAGTDDAKLKQIDKVKTEIPEKLLITLDQRPNLLSKDYQT